MTGALSGTSTCDPWVTVCLPLPAFTMMSPLLMSQVAASADMGRLTKSSSARSVDTIILPFMCKCLLCCFDRSPRFLLRIHSNFTRQFGYLQELIRGKRFAFIGGGVSHKRCIEQFVELGAQVTLCLNGHTLRLADGAEGCIIFVAVSDKTRSRPSLPSPTATERTAPAIITSTKTARLSLTTAAMPGRRPISRQAKRTRLPVAGSPAQQQARSAWAIITSFI